MSLTNVDEPLVLSPLRQAIVAEALTWDGTPYVHRQRCRQVGVDCVGLPLGICFNLGYCQRTCRFPIIVCNGIYISGKNCSLKQRYSLAVVRRNARSYYRAI